MFFTGTNMRHLTHIRSWTVGSEGGDGCSCATGKYIRAATASISAGVLDASHASNVAPYMYAPTQSGVTAMSVATGASDLRSINWR